MLLYDWTKLPIFAGFQHKKGLESPHFPPFSGILPTKKEVRIPPGMCKQALGWGVFLEVPFLRTLGHKKEHLTMSHFVPLQTKRCPVIPSKNSPFLDIFTHKKENAPVLKKCPAD
jgi:hypothetical protein